MSEARGIAVTGSASGLGAAVAERLAADGARVIGVDRHGADVVADLGTAAGRRAALDGVARLAGGALEGVVSCAGLGPYDDAPDVIRVNYFGAVAMLDGLRDLLAAGREPAAVAISSVGAVFEVLAIPELLQACAAGDEPAALAAIQGQDGNTAYVNAKRALALAVRRRAAEWGGLGIRLNAVAPGHTQTPMLDRLLQHEALGPAIRGLPVPLGRFAPAPEVAGAVSFLLGRDARYVHGHVLFADGGADAAVRPETF